MGVRALVGLVLAASSVRPHSRTCVSCALECLGVAFVKLVGWGANVPRNLATCPTPAAAPTNAPCRAQPIKVTPFGDRRALQGDGLDVVQGPACAADISDDGKVNVEDLLALLASCKCRNTTSHAFRWSD